MRISNNFCTLIYVLFINGGEKMVKEIIKQFNEYIYNKQITQVEAAQKIGCSQEHLSRVLRGKKSPSMKLLMKMEEVMQNDR
jgi:DNA-binding XRE family transcriptional regulator